MAAEVVAAIWEAVEEVSMVEVATAEVSAATTVDTAAELMVALPAAELIREVTQAEEDTAAHIQAEAQLLPGRGRGKARARLETLPPAGTDLPEITAL